MQNENKLFSRQSTHPLVLSAALFEGFGEDWLAWDPDSISLAIKKKFGADVSKKNFAKINAVSAVYSNHAYWEDWRAFEVISWSMSGYVIDPSILNPPTDLVMVYAKTIIDLIDPNTRFKEETANYIVGAFLHEQYSLLPPQFQELQKTLFIQRPDLSVRAKKVQKLLGKNKGSKQSIDLTNVENLSPEKVEANKHMILQTTNDMINSKEFVLRQAEFFGLRKNLQKFYGKRRK